MCSCRDLAFCVTVQQSSLSFRTHCIIAFLSWISTFTLAAQFTDPHFIVISLCDLSTTCLLACPCPLSFGPTRCLPFSQWVEWIWPRFLHNRKQRAGRERWEGLRGVDGWSRFTPLSLLSSTGALEPYGDNKNSTVAFLLVFQRLAITLTWKAFVGWIEKAFTVVI